MGFRAVVQRVESAKLLVDNQDEWVYIARGIVVYIAFRAGAREADVAKYARWLLHSAKTCVDSEDKPASASAVEADVLIVPQASLAGVFDARKKSISYRSLAPKGDSEILYNAFVTCVRELAAGSQATVQAGTFGNRQALDIRSAGPYTHLFEFDSSADK